ncbi:MAG TPA: glycosyltransferase, partial [Deferrisomatales bacterium]|nr:glycosyltransferase [Deferrisomatales bacterium]
MASRIRPLNIMIGAMCAVLTVVVWALGNRPNPESPWPTQVAGMSFSPLRMGNDPEAGEFPSRDEIAADLALLSGKVKSVRTYGVGGTLADIPELAKGHRMSVGLGAWLTGNLEDNEQEIARLIEVARANRNVTRVFVGNETLLRGDLTVEQLIGYLDRVRRAVKVPVSTGEPWNVWLKHPELAAHADYVAAHFLPYWEGIGLGAAVGHVVATVGELRAAFPKKPVLLAEVGWPSNGRTRRGSVASQSNEAIFLRRFLEVAQREKYDYYLMEAFDQPWKAGTEGSVGAYWGVYDVYRNQKFAFTEPIVRVPQWRLLAGASVALAAGALCMLLLDGGTLRSRGRGFLAAIANGVAAAVVWVAYDYAHQYLTPFTITIGIALAAGFLGITLVLLTEAHELAEATWVTRRRRPFGPLLPGGGVDLPKVSIHVPAYDEPPEMMIETLNALARLDYPHYEVLVIDNNTADPAVWQPVEEHCRRLGEGFRFFHVAPLKGFKAGALNFTLAHTAADAEVVAVIDSDYQVRPTWLRDLVPHFARPEIGFVQAPQDYRDETESAFKAMCYAEYKGFFH